MKRSYYASKVSDFIKANPSEILGELSRNHGHTLEEKQRNAWLAQIDILKNSLSDMADGTLFWEFSIPRMGKRADNILLYKGIIFVFEFKIGGEEHNKAAIDQTMDYALDLKYFHEGSHQPIIASILVSTKASSINNYLKLSEDKVLDCVLANEGTLNKVILQIVSTYEGNSEINSNQWENSIYKPTPTIIQAAQALYRGHNVREISRSDASAKNLSDTNAAISQIIEKSKKENSKAIVFVTGVPGAGKTLAGLNIANERQKADINEHAVFLSGNGPLILVLREALARDDRSAKNMNEARRKASVFIQNIHHFRDDNLRTNQPPIEKVVVFDEAQRAWDIEQTGKFMKERKGIVDFGKSEPEFLIDVMNRHTGWCVLICLIGGGQEINKGEAGLLEWSKAIHKYNNWHVYYSDKITDEEYIQNYKTSDIFQGEINKELHLNVSIRSFRTELLSKLVHHIISNEPEKAQDIYSKLKDKYPICISRDLASAKKWIKRHARGTEQYGIIASSGAIRLKPDSINVKQQVKAPIWFLNDRDDIRSSYFMEDVATEFDIQGLEIDWACVCWDADLRYKGNAWAHYRFKGTKWQKVNNEENIRYLENAYRVLLTRARQGMVIYVPQGSNEDPTRKCEYYNEIYNYLKKCGVKEISVI